MATTTMTPEEAVLDKLRTFGACSGREFKSVLDFNALANASRKGFARFDAPKSLWRITAEGDRALSHGTVHTGGRR